MYSDMTNPLDVSTQPRSRKRARTALLGGFLTASLVIAGMVGMTGCSGTASRTAVDAHRADKVIVKKSQRKLELHSNGRVIREYRVALGGSPDGHKFSEGDQRTPIGEYLLDWRNPKSAFYKSIHISYPNERDKLVSRALGYANPGGAIMIHGLPNYVQSETMRRQYLGRDWTAGCIAVQNHEMDEIWQLVRDGTPINILP
jgi:murein L,D-transpeptidase YafK